MEALNSLSETEPIETLRVALDQMRHFLWFYSEVMRNEPEFGDKMRQAGTKESADGDTTRSESSFLDQLSRADELMLLHHMVDAKRRKPPASNRPNGRFRDGVIMTHYRRSLRK